MTLSLRFFQSIGFGFVLLGLTLRLARAQEETAPVPAKVPGTEALLKPVGQMQPLSDFGAEDSSYLAVPTTAPTLGLLLVPEAFGLDAFTKQEALRLAGLGYLVLAVDIYNGQLPTEPDQVASQAANINTASAMKTIEAGLRFFAESPKFRMDRVVAIGWGTGARFVLQEAREPKKLDGAVTFYGPLETDARVTHTATPICAIFPTQDPATPRDSVLNYQRSMRAEDNDCSAWFIAAGPGWSDPLSKNYNPIEDREAWKVALPFLVRINGENAGKPKSPSVVDKIKDLFHQL